jgi:peptide/nickel transport system substrate-binding protein
MKGVIMATGLRCALIALFMLSTGCTDRSSPDPGTAGAVERGGTVVVAAPQDLEAPDILVAQNRYTQEILRYALFVPLLRYGPRLELEPALAASWSMTGDTGAVFELRHDVHWHDGPLTTALDAKFTIDRAMDPQTAFPNASDFGEWTGSEVIDSFSIRVSWRPHNDPLAGLPFLPVMPKHLLDSVPANALSRASFNENPVGNGPFRFVEHRANDRWIFEANDDFPDGLGGRPNIDRLVWRVIPDPTAQLTEVRTGAVDVILNVRPESIDAVAADASLQTIIRSSRQYAFIGWNGRRKPFGDARVRRALTLALDRQRMIELLRNGHGTLAVGPIGPYHWAYADSLAPLPFDSAAARKLLAEAGITDRNGDGRLDLPDGRPFRFELDYPASNTFNRDLAEMVAADLASVGVTAVPAPVEQNTLIARMTSDARDFDATLMGWESDFRINLGDLFHGRALDGAFQIAHYSNPSVDSLIDRTARLVDRDQAGPLYARLQQILRDDEPWTFLYYYPDVYVASARLHGVDMDIRGAFVNLNRWWKSGSAAR